MTSQCSEMCLVALGSFMLLFASTYPNTVAQVERTELAVVTVAVSTPNDVLVRHNSADLV